MSAITCYEKYKIKPKENSYFYRAIFSISYLQNDKRPKQRSCARAVLSSSSRFDDPLPDEEHGKSIKESSNIEHGEVGSAKASHLSNQNDNLVNKRQNEM